MSAVVSKYPRISLVGAPTDIGAGARGGAMGPEAIRVAGIEMALRSLGLDVVDKGNLSGPSNPNLKPQNGYRHLKEVVTWCEQVREAVYQSASQGDFPVLLGGDHSLAIGSVAGISRYCAENKKNLAILWLDAHADFNSADTSPSGNIHGMPAAVIQGVGHPDLVKICQSQPMFVKPVELIQVGIRSVDAAEKLMLNQSTVKVFDMRLIDEIGVRSIMERALGIISKIKSVHLHVSFDIDFLDPTIAPGVATTVSGGVNYREAQLMMEMIHDSGLASSLDIVELNSAFDDHNKTANLTVELIESFFGKQVLARNPARSLLDTND